MLLFVLALSVQAPAPAVVLNVSGQAEVSFGPEKKPLVRGAEVQEGSYVSTGADGLAVLRLKSGSMVRMGHGTIIQIDELELGDPVGKRKESMKLKVGRVWARVMSLFGGSESRFVIATDNAVAGVRGTAFFAEAGPDGSNFVLDHGTIFVQQGDKEVVLDQPGESVGTTANGLGAPGQLDAAALLKLRQESGGAAAGLLATLGDGEVPPPEGDKEALRQDLIGPDGVVDTLSGSPLQPEGPTAAELLIRLERP